MIRIKEFQKRGYPYKQTWYKYVLEQGSNSFDPTRHPDDMLANFVNLMDAGDLDKVVQSFADGNTAPSWQPRNRRRKQPEGEWGSEQPRRGWEAPWSGPASASGWWTNTPGQQASNWSGWVDYSGGSTAPTGAPGSSSDPAARPP